MKYISSKGEVWETSEMPDAYLLNLLAKTNKWIKEMEERLAEKPELRRQVELHLTEKDSLLSELKREVQKRHLVD